MSVQLFNLVLSWGQILGLVPVEFSRKSTKPPGYKICYSLILAALFVAMEFRRWFSMPYSNVLLFFRSNDFQTMCKFIMCFTEYCLTIHGILVSSLRNKIKWTRLVLQQRRNSDACCKRGDGVHYTYYAYGQFMVILLFPMFHNGLRMHFLLNGFMSKLRRTDESLVFGISETVLYYIVYYHFVMLSLMLERMRRQYQRIELHFERFLRRGQDNNLQLRVDSEAQKFLLKIENEYCCLHQAIEDFITIFGWPILLLLIIVGLTTLRYVIFLKDTFRSLGLASYVGLISETITFLGGPITIAIYCHSVTRRARRLVHLSHGLHYLPIDRELADNFEQTLATRVPTFSANRFFNIDKTLVISLFCQLITFFIFCDQIKTFHIAKWITRVFSDEL